MMTILAMILVALWVIGVVAGSTRDGLINLLLAPVLAMVLLRLIRGRLTAKGTHPDTEGIRERVRLPSRAGARLGSAVYRRATEY